MSLCGPNAAARPGPSLKPSPDKCLSEVPKRNALLGK